MPARLTVLPAEVDQLEVSPSPLLAGEGFLGARLRLLPVFAAGEFPGGGEARGGGAARNRRLAEARRHDAARRLVPDARQPLERLDATRPFPAVILDQSLGEPF